MNRLLQKRTVQSSLQRIQTVAKRSFNTNNPKSPKVEPPQTPAAATPAKPAQPVHSSKPSQQQAQQAEQKKGGGGGVATLLFLLLGGFTGLAYFAEQEHPIALHVADQPIIKDVLPYFQTLVRQVVPKQPAPQIPQIKPAPLPPKEETPVVAEPEPEVIPSPDELSAPPTEEVAPAEEPVEEAAAPETSPAEEPKIEIVVAEEQPQEVHEERVEEAAPAPAVVEESAAPDVTEHHASVAAAPAQHETSSSGLPQVHAEVNFQTDRTHEAVGQVLTNVSRNSIILRQELEGVLLRDIHNLDAPALRIRITQLVAELFERLSWESIRISQSVVQVEKEITEKYALMMKQQRKELEFEIEKILFAKEKEFEQLLSTRSQELEAKYQAELSTTVRSQAEGFQSTLTRELDAQRTAITTQLVEEFNNHLANLHKHHQDQLLALLPKVESLAGEVKTYHRIIDETQQVIDQTVQLHDISTALLGLELLLTNQNNTLSSSAGQSISAKLTELKSLSNADALIAAIIDTIPKQVKEQGVLSANELTIRFQILHDEIRKVALAPQSPPPMIGQAIGSMLASISLKPKGYIQGSGIEETMARAYYQLERGKLSDCLKELEQIKGYSKVLLKDWQELANDRLVVDQAILALKAESLVRHKSFRS